MMAQMATWYYSTDGRTKSGPVDSRQLRELARCSQITQSSMVWKEGLPKWVAAAKIQGLFTVEQQAPPPLTEPAESLPGTPEPVATESPSDACAAGASKGPRSINRLLIDCACWGAVGAILWNIVGITSFIDNAINQSKDRNRMALIAKAAAEDQRLRDLASQAASDAETVTVVDPPPVADQPHEDEPAPDSGQFRFMGLSLDMTPGEVNEAAPRVNTDFNVPQSAVVGFWSEGLSAAPAPGIPDNASGRWYYGYSLPGSGKAPLWQRVGWVCVSFGEAHRTVSASIKIRSHYCPLGPMGVPPNDLTLAELAKRMVDSYAIPMFNPKPDGSGWQYRDLENGYTIEFGCSHWTLASARCGIKDRFLSFSEDQMSEFVEEVRRAKASATAGFLFADGEAVVIAELASRLETAWIFGVSRTSKAADVEFD